MRRTVNRDCVTERTQNVVRAHHVFFICSSGPVEICLKSVVWRRGLFCSPAAVTTTTVLQNAFPRVVVHFRSSSVRVSPHTCFAPHAGMQFPPLQHTVILRHASGPSKWVVRKMNAYLRPGLKISWMSTSATWYNVCFSLSLELFAVFVRECYFFCIFRDYIIFSQHVGCSEFCRKYCHFLCF